MEAGRYLLPTTYLPSHGTSVRVDIKEPETLKSFGCLKVWKVPGVQLLLGVGGVDWYLVRPVAAACIISVCLYLCVGMQTD